jgi:hypothetical protein
VVPLDGAGSTDPDQNYPLTFSWTLVQVPEGSAAELAGADTATPSFTADLAGDYVVELVVTDALDWPSLPDTVTISATDTSYLQPANTMAASYGRNSLIGSGVFNEIALLFIPLGAVVVRILRKRR